MLWRVLAFLLAASAGCLAAAHAARNASVPTSVVALLPVQDRAGDREALDMVEQALLRDLGERSARVVDPELARSVLRRLRIRNGDETPADLLSTVAREMQADWLVMATVHDAERRGIPRLTLSARAYHGSTGEIFWAAFEGGSGLDRRTIFGLRTELALEQIVPRLVRRLTSDLDRARSNTAVRGKRKRRRAERVGTVALVPVGGLTEERRLATAETVTEAVRAALYRDGVRLASPSCSGAVVRGLQGGSWGGVAEPTRDALRATCGADAIVTGSVETYEVTGQPHEPEPLVAISLRMVDAVSGRILWADALERSGWNRRAWFRAGRVHSRGELARHVTETLADRLVRKRRRSARELEELR